MGYQFLRELEIKNFKCFKELKLEGLKRVNLITGENGIGKTALMEAIDLFTFSNNFRELAYMANRLMKQYDSDFISKGTTFMELNTVDRKVLIKTCGDIVPTINLIIDGERQYFAVERLLESREDTAPVDLQKKILAIYKQLTNLERDRVSESLREFNKDILTLNMTVESPTLMVHFKDKDSSPLSSLGKGICKYVGILCGIWASKDRTLFIDGLEKDIHYTNYKSLWDTIFKTSEESNCQLFITTHSKECIEAFTRVNRDSEGSFFELYRNKKTGLIQITYRENEQLKYALASESEIRGE